MDPETQNVIIKIAIYILFSTAISFAYVYLRKKALGWNNIENNECIKIIGRKYISYKTYVFLIEIEGSKFILVQTPSQVFIKRVNIYDSFNTSEYEEH